MTTLALLYEAGDQPTSILTSGADSGDLFESTIKIATDAIIAEELLFRIREEISEAAHDHVIYAFLSEHQSREMILYDYIQKGFSVGENLDCMLTEDSVLKIHALARKVAKEVHRFYGFVRFSELVDGCYYSTIEPDFHILPLLAPHFAQRLSDQNWIIHDLKRDKAAIYNKKSVCVTKISQDKEPVFAQEDGEHKRLWQQYYNTIGIKERANPKLRQQFMPKKYQKHLVEMQISERRAKD